MSNTPSIPVNPTLPNIALELDGTTYRLAFDFNALCMAEEVTGQNLMQRVFDLREMPAKTFRAVLWASLLKAQPDVTLERSGALITPGNIPTIYSKLVEAWFASVPTKDKESTDPNAQTPVAQ